MAKKFNELTKHWPPERKAEVNHRVADAIAAMAFGAAGIAPGDMQERVDPFIPLWSW